MGRWKALKRRKLRNTINVRISSLTPNDCLLYTWVPLYNAAHYISRLPIKRERGSLEDGILQRIKNSLSSFHLHFILLRSLISYEQIPHQLWPFSGKIKTPLHLMCRLLAIYLTIFSDLELLQEIRVIGHTSWAFWQIGEMAPTS